MKWGQRTKLDELVLHKAGLAQWQLFHQGTRLFERGHVQEEHGACLRLAYPPLVDLASQIQSKRSRHFFRKELLYLFRRWRLRELPDSQNFCCRDYWEIALRHLLGVGRLVLNTIHIQFLSQKLTAVDEDRYHSILFPFHPFAKIWSAVLKFHPIRFTTSEKAHHVATDQTHVFQI